MRETKPKTRAIVKWGYGDEYVVPVSNAIAILESMEEAEHYESRYEDDGSGQGNNTDMIYIGRNKKIDISVSLITEDDYNIGKLRGAREET